MAQMGVKYNIFYVMYYYSKSVYTIVAKPFLYELNYSTMHQLIWFINEHIRKTK